MTSYSYRVTVIGHLAIDVTTDMSDTELALDRHAFSDFDRKIRNRLGGTALVLAEAAQALGCSVTVIGKVGADTYGNIIIEELHNRGITTLITTANDSQTGTVIMVYMSNDRRILLGDRGANAYLEVEDIDNVAEHISSSNVFIVSGYVLLDASARAAACRAMQIARDAGVFVAFDVVPHTIHRVFSFSNFVELTLCSNAVMLEINTARRFLGFEQRINQQHSATEVNEIVEILLKYYELVILNLTNDIQLIADRRSKAPWQTIQTGYTQASDKVGYLDRIFVRSVCEYIDRSKGYEHDNR